MYQQNNPDSRPMTVCNNLERVPKYNFVTNVLLVIGSEHCVFLAPSQEITQVPNK